MERVRALLVVAIVEAAVLAALGVALGAALSPRSPSPPPESLEIRVAGVGETASDGYGHAPGPGNTFLNVSVEVVDGLVRTVVLDNASFTLGADGLPFGGVLAQNSTRSVPAGEADIAYVIFELPEGALTEWVPLVSGAVRAETSFSYRLSTGGGAPTFMGTSLSVTPDGSNWSLMVSSASRGLLPATTYIQVRTPTGQLSLPRTAWASLSWAAHSIAFEDANPASADLRPGDALLISRAVYFSGSQVVISTESQILVSVTL